MAAPAIWYFDVISPFAYVALTRLDEIARHRRVVLKPIVFGAVLKAWGQLGPAEIAPKRVHTYRLVTHAALALGLPFRFPPAHPFNPLAMLRLLTALDGNGAAVREAFSQIWGQGRDANDPAVLAAVAQAGGDAGALERTGDQAVKDALRQATEEAIAAGRLRRADPADRRRGILGRRCDGDGAGLSRRPGGLPRWRDGARLGPACRAAAAGLNRRLP